MIEGPNLSAATLPIGAIPDADGGAVGLVCNEVWGGNRAFTGPIELPGMRGILFSQPCEGARGGDVHYLSVCGSGLLSRVCLADVTGHGESVAAVSQTMHELLRRSVNRMDQRKVLRKLNLRLSELDDGSFTTAAVLTYFPPMRRLSVSYAGHEPAWYYEASNQRWSQLEPTQRRGLFDIVLAVEPRTRYTQRVRRVALGDRLLMLTDGVLEAPNESGDLFGRKGLSNVLQSAHDLETEALVSAIMEKLREHTNGAALHHDDVSLLMIEFVDNLESPALWTALQNRLFRRRRENSTTAGWMTADS
jgi:sigma-B regulation protein RsbU (phosphoserine phosphatase)